MPSRTIPGAGSGKVRLGTTQPVFPRETPPPISPRSSSVTEAPARVNSQAQASPMTPPPTTTTEERSTWQR